MSTAKKATQAVTDAQLEEIRVTREEFYLYPQSTQDWITKFCSLDEASREFVAKAVVAKSLL